MHRLHNALSITLIFRKRAFGIFVGALAQIKVRATANFKARSSEWMIAEVEGAQVA